jgi:hypothetical protein
MTESEFKSLISVSSIVAAVFALYTAQKSGTAITGQLVAQTFTATTSNSDNVATLIQSGVDAIKSLETTGKLPASNAAADALLVAVDQYLPGLDAATLRGFVEKVVPLLFETYQTLSATPAEPVTPTPPTEPAG